MRSNDGLERSNGKTADTWGCRPAGKPPARRATLGREPAASPAPRARSDGPWRGSIRVRKTIASVYNPTTRIVSLPTDRSRTHCRLLCPQARQPGWASSSRFCLESIARSAVDVTVAFDSLGARSTGPRQPGDRRRSRADPSSPRTQALGSHGLAALERLSRCWRRDGRGWVEPHRRKGSPRPCLAAQAASRRSISCGLMSHPASSP